MEEPIYGWSELAGVVGVSHYIIRRWLAMYGFPKPMTDSHKKKWNRAQVMSWIDENSEFVKREDERCNAYRRISYENQA
jgi:hypothetical protein